MRGDIYEGVDSGVTITFKSETGETRTRTAWTPRGGKLEAVRGLCEQALRVDPSFKVMAISTVSSIYTDTIGRRENYRKAGEKMALIETILLGRIGLLSMAHPSLLGVDQAAVRRRVA